MSKGLFVKNKDGVELYKKLDDVQRLFHRQMVGEGLEELFLSLLEAQRNVSILSNDILLTYCGDYTSEERKTYELVLSDISSHLLSCISSVEMFGVIMISKKGEDSLCRINDAISKANNFKELSEFLKQVRI